MRGLCCIILGMHRSGTSCLARILNRAGLAMGDDLMLEPDVGNLIGHWESVGAVEINDRILARSNGQWDRIPEKLLVEQADHAAIETFLKRFEGAPVFGWKDPRMTLTYSIWSPHLDEHRLLACFRHPYAVAQSLEKRDGIPFESGLELWANYNERLLVYAAGKPDMFWFRYDGAGDEYWDEVRAFCQHTGLRFEADLLSLYNPCLTHYRGEAEIAEPRIREIHSRLIELARASQTSRSGAARVLPVGAPVSGSGRSGHKDAAVEASSSQYRSMAGVGAAVVTDSKQIGGEADRPLADVDTRISQMAEALQGAYHVHHQDHKAVLGLLRKVEWLEREITGLREREVTLTQLVKAVGSASRQRLRQEKERVMKTTNSAGTNEKPNGSDGRPRAPSQFHCITPVWGAKYVERFVSLALPSLLVPGNLPSLPAEKCIYQVLTRSEDVPQLLAAPSFQRLQELVSVSIELIDDIPLQHPYIAMTLCHRRAIESNKTDDAAYVFLLPDHVWSDGSFVAMQKTLDAGKRAVVVAGIRVRAESAEPRFRDEFLNDAESTLSIPPRSLVDLMLSNFHPQTTAQLVDAAGNLTVSRYYWDVNGHGMIARCFDLLPMVVWPSVSNAEIPTTFDHEYVRLSCPEYSDVHIVTDSDEICVVEISDSMHHTLNEISYKILDTPDVVGWMGQWTNRYHRAYFQTPIYFHSGDFEPGSAAFESEWSPILKRSNDLVDALMAAYRQAHADSPDQGESLVGVRLLGRPEVEEPASVVSNVPVQSLTAPKQLPTAVPSAESPSPPLVNPPPAIHVDRPAPVAEPVEISRSDSGSSVAAQTKIEKETSRQSSIRWALRMLRSGAAGLFRLALRPVYGYLAVLEQRVIRLEQGIPHSQRAHKRLEIECRAMERRLDQRWNQQLDLMRTQSARRDAEFESGIAGLRQSIIALEKLELDQAFLQLSQRLAKLEKEVPRGNGHKAWMLNSYRESLSKAFEVRRIVEARSKDLYGEIESLKKQLSAIENEIAVVPETAIAGRSVSDMQAGETSQRAA